MCVALVSCFYSPENRYKTANNSHELISTYVCGTDVCVSFRTFPGLLFSGWTVQYVPYGLTVRYQVWYCTYIPTHNYLRYGTLAVVGGSRKYSYGLPTVPSYNFLQQEVLLSLLCTRYDLTQTRSPRRSSSRPPLAPAIFHL